MRKKASAVIPANVIEHRIFLIRGHRVLLDSDLAGLYEVSTKRLNEQVKRNRKRFPEDFMFRLTLEEARDLKPQDVALSADEEGMRSQFATGSKKTHRN